MSRIPLVIFYTLALLVIVLNVRASTHSSSATSRSHARKSLAFRKKSVNAPGHPSFHVHGDSLVFGKNGQNRGNSNNRGDRRGFLDVDVDTGSLPNSLPGDDPPPPSDTSLPVSTTTTSSVSSTSSTSSDLSTTSSSASSTVSTTDSTTTSSASSTPDATSTGPTSTAASTSGPVSSDAPPPSTQTTATSTTDTSQSTSSSTSDPTSSTPSTPGPTSSTPDPTSSTPAPSTGICLDALGIPIVGCSSVQPTSTSVDSSSSVVVSTTDVPTSTPSSSDNGSGTLPSSTTNAPTSSTPPDSTSVGPTTTPPPTSTTDNPTPSSSSAPVSISCAVGLEVVGDSLVCIPVTVQTSTGSQTSSADTASSTPPATSTSAPDSTSSIPIIISASISLGLTTSSTPDSSSVTTSAANSQPTSSQPITTGGTTSSLPDITSATSIPTSSGPVSVTTTATVTTVTISFPNSTALATNTTITSAAPTTSIPPIPTQFTFLTQTTSLLIGSVASTTIPATLTNPDAPITDPTALPTSALSSVSPTPISLPSYLAARVYPPTPTPTPDELDGYTLIALLFDSELSWTFVTSSTESEGQLFAWTPMLIESALGLTQDQVKTFALQVYIPEAYQGPQDASTLLTTILIYIPTPYVSDLASQLKARESAFYTSLGTPYKDLATHVDPSFAITSISPNTIPGGGTSSTSNSPTGASSSNSSRTDAIIGVVSALGGLTLITLTFLVYRSIKKRREMMHQRLVEEPQAYPDRTGREFDQDSVGGQRRRSFYFAEDSLRGYGSMTTGGGFQQVPQHSPAVPNMPGGTDEYSYFDHADSQAMRERRPGGQISAPVLQQSSMNW